tara:strand:- start:392 stop:628 length:237 start_codon:yes stop_codon:yes gene_type:complete
MDTTYNGFEIDHNCAKGERLTFHYQRKALNYRKLGYALERKAKRAGKDSKEYTRYLKLLETSSAYSALAKNVSYDERG